MPTRRAAKASGRSAATRELRLVVASAPARAAQRLARGLVEGRHAACVSLVPGMTSHYRWKGRVETSKETLLLAKTTAAGLRGCLAALAAAHPYEVPEGLALTPGHALLAYAAWVRDAVAGSAEEPPPRRLG